MIRVTVLGTGTSTGVPSVACDCPTCRSTDSHDRRLRTSLLLQSATTTVVIDTSLDFREQMLRHQVMRIDALVYTHHHFDHIGGFDDIRPYNGRSEAAMPLYGMPRTLEALAQTFPYAFSEPEQLGGGVPQVATIPLDEAPFTIGDITLQPVPLWHGKLRVNGYRIGSFAYCTDTNAIPESSMAMLRGLDTLILDGLRWAPHPTHFTIDEAVAVARELAPRQTWLTHIAHQVRHAEGNAYLPPNIQLAHDNLTFTIPG